jgi:hypothetical protein
MLSFIAVTTLWILSVAAIAARADSPGRLNFIATNYGSEYHGR